MPVFLMPAEKGRRIVLDKAVTLLGRHPDCDVVLTGSRKVSRRHCCVAQVNQTFVVRDLGSMNGVRVNGQRIEQESPLKIGDELVVGDVVYLLEAQPHPTVSRRNDELLERDTAPPPVPISVDDDDESIAMGTEREPDPAELSQRFPVPLADEHGAEFEVIDSAMKHRKSGDDESDDVIPICEDERAAESAGADEEDSDDVIAVD